MNLQLPKKEKKILIQARVPKELALEAKKHLKGYSWSKFIVAALEAFVKDSKK